MSQELMIQVSENLKKRGFTVEHFATGREAADWVFSQIAEGETIGVGGTVTIQQIGLADTLRDAGHEVNWHWYVPGPATLHKANECDVYLASSNAVTRDGQLVNIDNTGNRVAAMVFGPKRVYLVVGSNKLVDGGVPQAIARIKTEACPPNARRLNKKTPCAVLGHCDFANCPLDQTLCGVTTVIDHPTRGLQKLTVVLVDEVLGY